MSKRWRGIASKLIALGSLIAITGSRSPAGASEPTPPTLQLGEHAVTVHVPPPGRAVLIFGFAQEVRHHVTTLRRWEQVLDRPDPNGNVTLELDRALPPVSVWAAVDLSTGLVAVAAPAGLAVRELHRPAHPPTANATTVDLELSMAELLLVRPGATPGAWGSRVGDGGASDVDGDADGVLRAEIASMWAVTDGPNAPTALADDDVLVVVDPRDLRFSATAILAKGGHQQ